MGQLILKRACSLRSEIRSFLSHLSSEKVDELANEFYSFLSDCVDKTDDADSVKLTATFFVVFLSFNLYLQNECDKLKTTVFLIFHLLRNKSCLVFCVVYEEASIIFLLNITNFIKGN